MDRLISVALRSIGCPSVTLKAEQKACKKSVYSFPLATVNICATRCYRSFLVTSLTGKTVLIVLVVFPLVYSIKLEHTCIIIYKHNLIDRVHNARSRLVIVVIRHITHTFPVVIKIFRRHFATPIERHRYEHAIIKCTSQQWIPCSFSPLPLRALV